MRSFLWLGLKALFLCGLVWPVWAAPVSFSQFEVDVPTGWFVEEDAEGSLGIYTDDGKAGILIELENSYGKDAQIWAEGLAAGMEGSAPVYDALAGCWRFDLQVNGESLSSYIYEQDGLLLVVSKVGETVDNKPVFDSILSSLKATDPRAAAMLKQ